MKETFHCGFDLHSLMVHDIEHLCMYNWPFVGLWKNVGSGPLLILIGLFAGLLFELYELFVHFGY